MRVGRLIQAFVAYKHRSHKFFNKRLRARIRSRRSQFDVLEARRLLAAAIWHNVLQPLNVSDQNDGQVSPLDALLIINELNTRQYSDPHTSALPASVAASGQLPFLDTSCDSYATALDALLVINAINTRHYDPSWYFATTGDLDEVGGQIAVSASCSPKLVEGNSLATELTQLLELTDDTSAVRVSFEMPSFDVVSQNSIRDAFEVLLLDEAGQLLVLPFGRNHDAAYNWSEEIEPAFGPGTESIIAPAGALSTATFNLAGLAAGTKVQVVVRLVNNDADTLSSVVIRKVELIDAAQPAPSGAVAALAAVSRAATVDTSLLVDVSASLKPVYGRTTLDEASGVLVTDLQLINRSPTALTGDIIVAIDNLSDPAIGVTQPDGFLPGGRPYFVFKPVNGQLLSTGQSTDRRELRFINPSRQQFTYSLIVLALWNSPPTGFTSLPLREIEASKRYQTVARAQDPDGQALQYAVLAGPEGMTIDSESGVLQWQTTSLDIGNHSVAIQAMDPYGLSVRQSFTIAVLASVQNRPPLFTSQPPTDATVASQFEVLTIPTGSTPIAIAAADFGAGLTYLTGNAGGADLTFHSNTTSQRVSLGEPAPNGFSFRDGRSIDVGLPPFEDNVYDHNGIQGFAQADFNGDGNLDFVTSNYTIQRRENIDTRQHALAIVLSNGDATFASPALLNVPIPRTDFDRFYSLLAEDFDRDGQVDIIGSYMYDNVISEVARESKIFFWKGLGDGSFAAPTYTNYSDRSLRFARIQSLDVDGDDHLDLIATVAGGTRVGVLAGQGDGTFGDYREIISSPSAGFYYGIALGDLDGINGPDLVMPDWQRQQMSIFLNDGAGAFPSAHTQPFYQPFYPYGPLGPDRPTNAYIGDFDQDGTADIVGVAMYSGTGGGGLSFYKGSGDGINFTFSSAGRGMPARANNTVGNGYPVDFNGDGNLDIVLGSGSGYYGITVALGKGDGTFNVTSVQNSVADRDPGRNHYLSDHGAAIGDYNRDGLLDVAVVGTRQDAAYGEAFAGLSILYADMPGVLAAPTDVAETTVNQQIVNLLGDLNNDGNLDLVVGDGARFYTRLGNGDGSFATPQIATPSFYANDPHDAFLADLNHDGLLDLVWSRTHFYQGANQGMMAALGNGDGTFTVTFGVPAPNFYGAGQMLKGDFNNDGYTDFAGAGSGAYAAGAFVQVWLNNVSVPGTFTQSSLIYMPFDFNTRSLVTSDFDSDGIADFIVFQPLSSEPRQLLFYKGKGDGTFFEPTSAPVFTSNSDIAEGNSGWSPAWTAAGDLNEDGKMDLVLTSAYSRSAVFLGNGDGTFETPIEYSTGTFFASDRQLHLIDLNADEHLDMVSIDDNQGRNKIAVRFGNGDGTFGMEQVYAGGGAIVSLAFGDVNNDRVIDMAASTNAYFTRFTTIFLGNLPSLTGVTTGDVNGDGLSDAIAINAVNNRVKVLLSNGDGSLDRQHDLIVGRGPIAVAAVDLDNDGFTDIVTANRAGRGVTVLANNGVGQFTRSDINVGNLLSAMSTGLLDGDGSSDVVVASQEANSLFLLLNHGQGLQTPVPIPLGDTPGQVAIGDVTGDGLIDIVVTLPESQRLMILPGDGAGDFDAPLYVQLNDELGGVGIADFNLDGLQDVALTLPAAGSAAILFSRSGGRFAKPQRIAVGENPTYLSIRDTDADGRPDILVANSGDATASIILNRFDPTKLLRATATATDPDGDPVTLELTDAPGGMIFDASSGQILWAPTPNQIGLNSVTITASDGRGGSATQTFTIMVTPTRENLPPVIFSHAPTILDASQVYAYTPSAHDPDGDTIRYRLLEGPAGASIDAASGQVDWDPRGGAQLLNRTFSDHGYIKTPMGPSITSSTSITVEGDFRIDRNEVNQSFFRKASYLPYPTTVNTFSLRYLYGQLRGTIGGPDANGVVGDTFVAKAWTPEPGRWYHLALTFDDASGVLSVYVDGHLFDRVATGRHLTYDGQDMNISYDYFDPLFGKVANFRMWNYAKSQEQLRADHLSSPASDAGGLVIDYRFDDGDAQTLRDHSQYANNGRRTSNGARWPSPSEGLAVVQTQRFVIQADDGQGGLSVQSFEVTVAPTQRHAIRGTVFSDNDGDGVQSGSESGLAGSLVFIDRNDNSVHEGNEVFAVTNSLGQYSIAGQLAGTYRIATDLRAGFDKPSVQEISLDAFSDSDATFALVPQPGASIRGSVWLDVNGNAALHEAQTIYASDFDATTPDLSLWSNDAIVTAPNGSRLLSNIVDAPVTLTLGSTDSPLPAHESLTAEIDLVLIDGWYGTHAFAGIHPTQWALEVDGVELLRSTFSNHNGYSQSYPQTTGAINPTRAGAAASNSFGYATDATYHLTFTLPHTKPTARFSFRAIDSHYNANSHAWALENVKVTAKEPAVANWPVYVDLNNNGFRDEPDPTAWTDIRGEYALTNLSGGEWVVRLDNSSGWTTTSPSAGQYDITLPAGGSSTGNDFVLVADAGAASQPRFNTQPLIEATARSLYRFDNVAVDPAFRPLTYSLNAAPDGMAVDPNSGTIIWTPSIVQVGLQRVILKAVNGQGGSAVQDFVIVVRPANTVPVVTSTPPTTAYVDTSFIHDVLAQDAEQTQLQYSLIAGPAGSSIDVSTGRITWIPNVAQVGSQQFSVRVSDTQHGAVVQSFLVTVLDAAANGPPDFDGQLRDQATVGLPYFARLRASDPDSDLLTFSLRSGPAGMSVSGDGKVVWTPAASQLGANVVNVSIDDGRGGIATRQTTIHVRSLLINHAPTITSTPATFALSDKLYAYDIGVNDADNDPVAFELVRGPSGVSLHPTRGTLRWLPGADQLGPHTISIRAIDPLGGNAEQTFVVTIYSVGGPPVIQSVPPTRGVVGDAYLYSVIASDANGDPLTYSLLTAPVGTILNSVTGELVWTPTADELGIQSVTIQVSDGVGGFTTQSYAIDVKAGLDNQAPTISSLPPIFGAVGNDYKTTIVASDPEGSSITFALRRGPASMAVDALTGEVTWTPTASDVGTVVVAFTATDANGAAAVQSFELEIIAANTAPVIVSQSIQRVTARNLVRYDVLASDANLDALKFELVSGPGGLTIDAFGRLRWQTTTGDLGAHAVTVRVSDPRGGIAEQNFDLMVVPDTTPPRVSVIPAKNLVRANSPEVFTQFNLTPVYPTNIVRVSAVDDVGVTDLVVTANGQPVALDAFGNALFSFKDWGFGLITIVATATDAAGNQTTGAKAFGFVPYGDDPAVAELANPLVAITSPVASSAVGGFVDIVGSATSDNFTLYTLSYRRGDSLIYETIATGTSPVNSGVLGQWDTTLLENDEYFLRLEVQDDIFGTTTYEQSVGVSGEFKLGNFRLSFNDLTLPVVGIPITLTRTYDTLRSDRDGDFGFGWRLEYRDTDLRTSLPKTGLEDLGIYSAFKAGTKVYITLPGGVREGYTFTPDMRVLPGFGNNLTVATPRFTPDRGVTNTLSVRGGTFLVNDFGDLMGSGGQPYNPAAAEFGGGFSLSTRDGTSYQIDGQTGLLMTIHDRNGNTLSFNAAGVTGPGGLSLTFERDMHGRITKVIDPAGKSMRYEYDRMGNLSRVTDRMGHTTELSYRSDRIHYLDKVIDPLGRTAIRAEYDLDGRLSATVDAGGNAVRTTYDPDNSLVTVRDALGNPTLIEYDARGNVVAKTDALGGVTRTTYDAEGRVASQSDATGLVMRYTYDSAGNRTSTTDSFGSKFLSAYDAAGNFLGETDPLGNSVTYTYDNKRNLITVTDALGQATSYTYNERGKQTSITDASGSVSHYAYDTAGNVLATTDPLGHITTFSYDVNGNQLTKTHAVSTPSGVRRQVTTVTYDASDRVVTLTDAEGNATHNEYDSLGKRSATIDALGRRTEYRYNERGLLIETVYPDATPIDSADNPRATYVYDALGRRIANIDEGGNRTEFRYDAAGRPTETIYPDATPADPTDNPRVFLEYDGARRVTARIDQLGNRTDYGYDAMGRVIVVRDALGHESTSDYDSVGRLIAATDPLGQTTRFVYDALGRLVQTIFPDGTSTLQKFDHLDRVVSATDQVGRATGFEYDPIGRLTAVVDPLGQRTTYEYDEVGNRIQTKDAIGRVTRYGYDGLGRQTSLIQPLGQRSVTTYDSVGNIVSTTDFNGNTIEYDYDSRDRLIAKRFPDDSSITVSYNSVGLRTSVQDARGTTSFQYDPEGQLLSMSYPDGQSIAYSYDLAGNRTSVTTMAGRTEYTFDGLNQISTVKDLEQGVTRYSYDAGGRLIGTRHANGTVETRTYDALNRLVSMETASAGGALSSYQYTLSPTGRRDSITEQNGHRVVYTYDALDRLLEEKIQDPIQGSRMISLTYDAVGNRLERLDSATGVTTYTYDANDRLLSETSAGNHTVYQYDDNGNLLSRTAGPTDSAAYAWDFDNRLTDASVTTTAGTKRASYVYDPDGNKVASKVGVDEMRHLIDVTATYAQVLADYTPAGTFDASYVFGHQLLSMQRGAERYFYLSDAIGSTRLITDEGGNVANSYSYDAFGRITEQISEIENVHLFTGERRDAALGWDYLRARNYDSATGRFTSRDSFEGFQRETLSLHDYIYAHADPVNRIDPSGHVSLGDVIARTALYAVLIPYVTVVLTRQYAPSFGFFGATPLGADIVGLFDGAEAAEYEEIVQRTYDYLSGNVGNPCNLCSGFAQNILPRQLTRTVGNRLLQVENRVVTGAHEFLQVKRVSTGKVVVVLDIVDINAPSFPGQDAQQNVQDGVLFAFTPEQYNAILKKKGWTLQGPPLVP